MISLSYSSPIHIRSMFLDVCEATTAIDIVALLPNLDKRELVACYTAKILLN